MSEVTINPKWRLNDEKTNIHLLASKASSLFVGHSKDIQEDNGSTAGIGYSHV